MGPHYLFVGNRRFVLEQMLREGVELAAVLVVKGTHLERDLQAGLLPLGLPCSVVASKSDLLSRIREASFDVLVSNGCPYILPVAQLPPARYVNIHPSYLPDLRGADPVIGSILFGRDAGATCHVMDPGIDTGPVVSQLRIPYTPDLDVTTLYQLSFAAEKRVFSLARARDFEPSFEQPVLQDSIYYSRRAADRAITFRESNALLLQKVRAFSNRAAGCEFTAGGRPFRVFSARTMSNPFLAALVGEFPPLVVALSYESGIVFHKDGEVLRFEQIAGEAATPPAIGDRLGDRLPG